MNQGNYGHKQGYGYAPGPGYPQPPRKKSNVWIWVLVAVGVPFAACSGLAVLGTVVGKPAREAAAASASAEKVRAAEEEAKKKADEDAKMREACKVDSDAKLTKRSNGDVIYLCREMVKAQLKAPATAEFPGIFDSDGRPTSLDGCKTVYRSYVDAQNAFGAKLRSQFLCTFDPVKDTVSARLLE